MTTALLLSVLSLPAGAQDFPACVRRTKRGYDEPRTLQGLLRCQERKRAGLAADEAFAESQRAEARDYLRRHPERASTEEPAAAQAPEAPADRKVAAQKARSRAAAAANAERLPEGQRQDLTDLNDKLWGMSKDGQLGLTPDMAKEIAGYLQKQQGGVSAEMSGLLQSLQKDGAKLSDGSVRQLKKAARDAKGEGLELGVEPGMEKWLLDPATDPERKAGEPGPVVD